MARVYVQTEKQWYEEFSNVTNYYETDIELRIEKQSKVAFNGYFLAPFKLSIKNSAGEKAKADLVLVREDYSAWFVVEVELFIHGKTHPEKQVDIFLDGIYNEQRIVDYLDEKIEAAEYDQLYNMIMTKRIQPGVLVIVDGPAASWIDDFRDKGAMVCIFEVYKGTGGVELFRLKGDYPYIKTRATHLKWSPSAYKLIDPNFIPFGDGHAMEVRYNDFTLKAKVSESDGDKYLIIENSLIPPRKELIIFEDINGQIILQLN